MPSETHGLEELSVDALRDRHAAHLARIAEIRGQEQMTLQEAREMRDLTNEANTIVGLVNEAREATATPLEEMPVIVVEEPPAVHLTEFVEGQEEEAVEAIAAAAALSANVSVRHEPVEHVTDAVVMPQQTLIASAARSGSGVDSGEPLTLLDVGRLVTALAGDRGLSGTNVHLVNLTPSLQAAAGMVSEQNSRSENTRIFDAALDTAAPRPTTPGLEEQEDLTAAVSFTVCGPPDILRDVPECDNTDRYLPGWFRNVQSTHGQIQFYRSFSIADALTGIKVWGQTEQAAVVDGTTNTYKPCVAIGCLPTVTVGVNAVSQCMTMPVFQTMSSPEAVASAIHAIRAATARVADGDLLLMLDTLSSKYTFDAGAAGNPLGATIDVYDALGRLLGMFAAANRQLDLSGYTLAVEAGFIEHLLLDNMMACNPRLAQEAAESLFSGLGIGNIVVTPDFATGGASPFAAFLPINAPGAAAAAIPTRPLTWTARLFDGTDFAYLSPGGDSFGIVPDLTLKRQNKVAWFGEIFHGLGKLGCKPAASVQFTNLKATGARGTCVAVP